MMNRAERIAQYPEGKRVHFFELAGLGVAPYRYDGCTTNIFRSGCGTVSKPGGACDYCGTAITFEFWLVSADGRKFKVGSDCILKHDDSRATRVAVETEVQRREREKRNAAKEAKRQRDVAVVAAAKALLPAVADTLRAMPHPRATENSFFAGKTKLDWAEWMLANAGLSGSLTVAKVITQAQEGGR
jgi:hypothetical protein